MKHFVTSINLLLICLPIAIVAELAHWLPTVIFIASCLIAAHVSVDGETNWLEGALLIGLYVVLAVAFFFLPAA